MKQICLILCLIVTPFVGAEELPDSLTPLIQEIEATVNKKDPETMPMIVIGGCPGVGKSTFADKLATDLKSQGLNPVIICLDHYLKSPQERKIYANELDPRRLKWDWMHRNMKEARAKAPSIVKPRINQLTREMDTETLELKGVDCVILEGLYALGSVEPMDFIQYADLAIYMQTSLENIFDWKWERDLKKIHPRTPEVFFEHMMSICRDFAFHIYYSKANADLILDVDSNHNYSLAKTDKSNSPLIPDFSEYRLKSVEYR